MVAETTVALEARTYGDRTGTVARVKTTVELDDQLVQRAKTRAAQERSSLRSLIEEALVRLLEEREARPSGYVLPDRSVGTGGMAPEHVAAGWSSVLEAAYAGRGS